MNYGELQEFFKDFQWIDNIPEDQSARDKICLEAKAALLIEANRDSERFSAFIRNSKKSHNDKSYQLPDKIYLEDINYDNHTLSLTCNSFELYNKEQNGQYWGPEIITTSEEKYFNCQVLPFSNDNIKIINYYSQNIESAFYEKYPTLYSICKDITPYKSPEQICRFWGASGEIFGKFKPRSMYPDYIWSRSNLEKEAEHENWTDARLEQFAFQFLIPCQHATQDEFALPNRYYDNWYCHVFPFHNQYGETIMNVVKIYEPETQCKILLPMTTWLRNNCTQSQIFCVPYLADKTPLYNLDKLLAPECKTVILCDSIELADANQNKIASKEVVFTGFVCSPGKYDQVDWSPLQDKELFLLVSNHSGITLETAALKAQELTEFLSENIELESKLLIIPIQYSSQRMRGFDNVDDILKIYQENPPQVNLSDLRILEYEDEIDEFFQAAEKELNRFPDKWWLKSDVPPEEKRIAEENSSKPKPIDYIMRPFLVRGEVAMLYAALKAGKSNLAYSIAARTTAAGYSSRPVPLLKEKWRAVPDKIHKVLYLDFENKNEMETKKASFQNGYFPKGKEQECRNNLIMRDCSMENIDFSVPENHQKLLDMLEDAKQNKGTPGKAVDLLIIDTYTAFIRNETPQAPANFKTLINKLRNMNIAILIVHHANYENKVRGYQSKMDSFYMTLNLSCDENEPEGDLNEQSRILKYENPREVMGSSQRTPFKIKFNSNKKQWYIVDDIDENQEMLKILNDYKKCNFERDAICYMLGLQKSAYSERLKKAKEKNK